MEENENTCQDRLETHDEPLNDLIDDSSRMSFTFENSSVFCEVDSSSTECQSCKSLQEKVLALRTELDQVQAELEKVKKGKKANKRRVSREFEKSMLLETTSDSDISADSLDDEKKKNEELGVQGRFLIYDHEYYHNKNKAFLRISISFKNLFID